MPSDTDRSGDPDTSAEQFLDLESELRTVPGADLPPVESIEAGVVRAAARVSNDAVPQDYPSPIATPTALRLDLTVADRASTAVYLPWPDRLTPDTRLAQFLTAIDVRAYSFTDIVGESIPIERDGGYCVVDLSSDPDSDDVRNWETTTVAPTAERLAPSDAPGPLWSYVAAGCICCWILTFVAPERLAVLGVYSHFAFPISVYLDATRVRTLSETTPSRLSWTILSAIPGLNLLLVGYLYKRHRAMSEHRV